MLDTEIVYLSHLAVRTLEENARTSISAERQDDGTWAVLMSETMANALRRGAADKGMSLSDYIVSLRNE